MRILYLLLLALLVFNAHSQNQKLGWRALKLLKEGKIEDPTLGLLVQGDAAKIEELTKRFKGIFKFSYGNISSVEIPTQNVLAFAQDEAVEHIEDFTAFGVHLMDSSRINSNVDMVHAGTTPLTKGYSGKGVVVGIIDGGIYWQHPDFKNPDGSARIRYIWDQPVTNPTVKPMPYNYGQEWSWVDINSNKCTHVPPYLASEFGHGTCVAGIAAGNGRSLTYDTLRYRGVAYESDIIAVRVPLTANNFLSRVVDAVDYIFKKADALGKPCVINTSVGTYFGSRDGRDFASRIIDSLLQQKKGRVLVAAAGNAGNKKYHIRHTLNGDSATTFFSYWNKNPDVLFDFWADSVDFVNVDFVVGATSTKSGNIVDTSQTQPLNILRDLNTSGPWVSLNRNLFVNNGSQLIASVLVEAEKVSGAYHVGVTITPVDTSRQLYWKLQTFGNGAIDLWSDTSLNGLNPIVSSLPNLLIKPDYRYPDSLKTMVSSWQNSERVITVANYSNRANYLTIDSTVFDLTDNYFDDPCTVKKDTVYYNETPGMRFETSSIWPTRDYRFKPDISAPGSTTVATGDLRLINGEGTYVGYRGNCNRYKVAIGGKHIRNGGTSMASPVVAGLAALYLEKRPTARWDEIKQAIIETAKRDTFTGPDANYAYGHGKLNAYLAMIDRFVYGCTDTASINYLPTATLDTGGCVKKVYGCTDVNALNYAASANVNNGTCFYETSLEKVSAQKKLSVRTYPNPFVQETFFAIDGLPQNFSSAEIVINDMIGRTEDKITLSKGVYQYRFANSSLPSGVHLFKLNVDGKTLFTGKVVKY